jgi:hypothetical protein
MKKYLALIPFVALLTNAPVHAQPFDPKHRHSIELSTGVPPAQVLLLGSSSSAKVMGGYSEKKLFTPSLNIAYTYAMNERWDFNVIVNACGAILRREYDTGTSKVAYSGTWYTPTVDFRWKWLRRDNFRLYSSFGLSCFVMGNFSIVLPLPYLTPVGINFGSGKLYGIAEFNVSTAATGLLAGIGYRF